MFLDKASLPYRSCRFRVNLLFNYIAVCLCLSGYHTSLWWASSENLCMVKKCKSQRSIVPSTPTRTRLLWVLAMFLAPTRLLSCLSNRIFLHAQTTPSTGCRFIPFRPPRVQECGEPRPGSCGDRGGTTCSVSVPSFTPWHIYLGEVGP